MKNPISWPPAEPFDPVLARLHRQADMKDQARDEIRRLEQAGLRGSPEYVEAVADYHHATTSMLPGWAPAWKV